MSAPVTNIAATTDDPLVIGGRKFSSRLLLGTSQYPSPAILAESVRASGAEIVTVASLTEAVLLEAAVRNHILQLRGIHSTEEFVARQQAEMQRQAGLPDR